MEIKDLVILAAKADSEGNFRVADRLTEKIETMSREAFDIFKPIQKLIGIGNRGQQNNLNFLDDIVDGVGDLTQGVPRRTGPRPKIETDSTPGGVPIRTGPKPKPDQTPVGAGTPVPETLKPPVVNPTVPPAPSTGTNPGRSFSLRDINQSNTDNSKNYNVGGLLAAALGAYGMYLMAGKIYDPTGKVVPPEKLPENIKQMFKANQLSMRSQAGQMGNEQAAQDFIEKYRYDPKFKTAQDFYYQAQREGQPQSMMNSIAALAKAEGFTDKTRFVD
jgi:hypothetical protein